MPVVPVINKDFNLLTKDLNDRIQQPKHQRNLVLIIVCIALLLDNMLYMVIVPIIPEYLHSIDLQANKLKLSTITTTPLGQQTLMIPIEQKQNKLNTTLFNNNQNAMKMIEVDNDYDDYQDKSKINKATKKSTTTTKSYPRNRVNVRTSSTMQQYTTTFLTTLFTTTKINKNDDDDTEDVAVGFLFASKAIIQLFINPFSGAFIDKIGYDIPMCIGLGIIFLSTMTFSVGSSYSVLLLARGLQGVGSAFADTAGLAMIADRFTEEGERSKALGIALAFISFGSLVAPPFGGILYEYLGRPVPFVLLSLLALFDGLMLFFVMRPHRIAMAMQSGESEFKPKGTPIWRLFMDPYIAVCAGALVMANVSLAFLEPTIAIWMRKTMNATESQMGLIWLPGFIPHLLGVLFTVWSAKKFPQYQWMLAAGGLALEGISCFIIPFCKNYISIMIPISGICFGIALVDTAILPTLGYLVDVRHTSVYGSIYAIADISYSLAYALGPIMAGNIMHTFGFFALNFGICFSNLLYAPVIYFLRYFYEFKPLESNELSAISNNQAAIAGAGFKRFGNDDTGDKSSNFQFENTTIDPSSTIGPNFNSNTNRNLNKPDSAVFQSMQKYPKKQSKNPYKDTHNLIDNMEEDEF
jgi:multidrug resistance protein